MTCYFVLLTFNIWLHYNKLLTYLFTYLHLAPCNWGRPWPSELWPRDCLEKGHYSRRLATYCRHSNAPVEYTLKEEEKKNPSSSFIFKLFLFHDLLLSPVCVWSETVSHYPLHWSVTKWQRFTTHSTEVWPSDSVSLPTPLKCDQVTAFHYPLHWSVTKWQRFITHSTEVWPSDSVSLPTPLKCDQVTASHYPLHWSVTKWQQFIRSH